MAKVKAIRKGFFGTKIRNSAEDNPSGKADEFEVTKEEFSANWMELLPGESFDEPKKPGRKAKAEVTEETEES